MKTFYFILSLWLLSTSLSLAQGFVYTPKNPAFGGNTFNYNWMISSAQAQDTKTDPNAEERTNYLEQRNSLDNFTEGLNRQLLSRLSRELLTDQFGEGGLEEGLFQIGDFQVDVSQGADGMLIRIFDGQGGETQITVPFP